MSQTLDYRFRKLKKTDAVPPFSKDNVNEGLSVFFTVLCIIDLFGVFPVITLPKSIIACGVYGAPLVIFVLGLQLYTAALLGRSWLSATRIAPHIDQKNRYPYAAIAELAFGRRARQLVTFLIDATVFGAGIPNLLVASQSLQLFWWKITGGGVGVSFCLWMLLIGLLLCPVMWLGSPKDMKPLAVTSVVIVTTVAICTWCCIILDEVSPRPTEESQKPRVKDFLVAYGIIAFQFDIHPMLLTIQVDMRERTRINSAVRCAFLVTGAMFAVTSLLAAYRYGQNVEANILQGSSMSESDPGKGTSARPADTYSTPPRGTSEHDVLEPFDDGLPAAAAKNTQPPQEQRPADIFFSEQNYEQERTPSNQSPRAKPLQIRTIDKIPNAEVHDPNQFIDLDEDVLEILGEDPTTTLKNGPDIRSELASRLQHISTEELTREDRKKLIEKYPLPVNCLYIGAPTVNPEIKAALMDNLVKRDKGIESKQKEMASAISCLTDIFSFHLNSKDKNNHVLQKLIDIGRILCDIQHGDSVTRRNFILFAVKSDMQEHLKGAKIDTFLFGQYLSDTLKSAKAVNKSGADLKPPEANKNIPKKAKSPLNRRAAATSHRPAGAAPATRGRAAAVAPRMTFPRRPQPALAYRKSSTQPQPMAQPQQQRRRRY